MSDVANKTIVITGASRGIGAAAARHFAAIGARVVLSARSAGAIKAIAGEITAAGGQALAVPCDVANAGDVSALMAAAKARFGAVDILVNNAGVIEPIARIDVVDPEGIERRAP